MLKIVKSDQNILKRSNMSNYIKKSPKYLQKYPKMSKLDKSKKWANVIYEWPSREVKNLVKNKTYIITFCPVDCEVTDWKISHTCPPCWGGDTNQNRSMANESNINKRIYLILWNMYMHCVPEGGNEAFWCQWRYHDQILNLNIFIS